MLFIIDLSDHRKAAESESIVNIGVCHYFFHTLYPLFYTS